MPGVDRLGSGVAGNADIRGDPYVSLCTVLACVRHWLAGVEVKICTGLAWAVMEMFHRMDEQC